MGNRSAALFNRQVQFVAIVLLLVAGIAILGGSGLAKGTMMGISNQLIFGLVGMGLLIFVVAGLGPKFFLSGLPTDDERVDVMEKTGSSASAKSVARLAQLKYGERSEKNGSRFEDFYKVKK